MTRICGERAANAQYSLLSGDNAGNHGTSMILLAWASSVFPSDDQGRRPRPRRSGRTAAVARLTHLLFYKPVGVPGTIARIGLLVIGAVVSYFVGSGLGELMMKAPVPMALMFGAAFFALASRDPDQR